jgi:peptidoglycan/LPS O-acetylase OafA/YrhL
MGSVTRYCYTHLGNSRECGLRQYPKREIVQDSVQTATVNRMEPRRLTSLDALRGVAALSIVVWHWQHFFAIRGAWQSGWTAEMQPLFWLLKPLYVQGWAAVDLFFVLSGFVFFWLYRDAIRNGAMGGWRFAVLRFSRLYPLHAAMLIAVALLQYFYLREHGQFFIYQDNDGAHFTAQLFMVQNWWPGSPQSFDGPTWSVSIEILLYLIFFAICRAGLRRGLHCFLLAAMGFLLLTHDEHIARGVIGFFMGGVMFAAWHRFRSHRHVAVVARLLAWTALAGWLGLCALLYADSPWLAQGEGNYLFLTLFDFGLCPLTVLALALRETAGRRTYGWLGFLGDISYSTYLIHFPLQLVLALVAARFALVPADFMHGWVMLVFFAVLIALGALSYAYVEKPAQSWLRARLVLRPAHAT